MVPDAPPADAALPGPFGPYRPVARLGAGGMGEVFLAVQEEPLRREVALKVIRGGFDSAEVQRRFESERQALALMDHPGIARVYDGGTSADGRPYFVMELVRGEPITDYCEARELDLGRRVRIAVEVCLALEHAHQKGVIHRDIKPSNVLVTEVDGRPHAKVIDFGIAKAVGGGPGDTEFETVAGQLVGTLDYMSPEQADGGLTALDTRSDVYSVGVLLYELFTGSRPHEATQLLEQGLGEALRVLRDETPPSPSTRLAALAASGSRSTTVAVGQLRGELDWIVMRALEKDPQRRYQSVAELGHDLERYLADEPVLAGPPSRRYRLGKFVRRHRGAVAAGAAAVLALLVGVAGLGLGLTRAVRAEEQATEEAAVAQEVSDFLLDLFASSSPLAGGVEEVSLEDLLERGRERVGARLASQPAARLRFASTIARSFSHLETDEATRDFVRDAVEAAERAVEAGRPLDPVVLSEAYATLAHVHGKLYELEQCERAALRAIELCEALPSDTPGARAALIVALRELAMARKHQERFDEQRALLERALAVSLEIAPRESASVAHLLVQLGLLENEVGDLAAAEVYLDEAIAILEAVDPENVDLARALLVSGLNARSRGDREGGRPKVERSLALFEAILGPDHTSVGEALANLASFYPRGEERVALMERALAIYRAGFPAGHERIGSALYNLAVSLPASEAERSRELRLEALAIREANLGPDHTDVGVVHAGLGFVELGLERYEESAASSRRAVEILEGRLGPDSRRLITPLGNLATANKELGRYAEAAAAQDRAVELAVAHYPEGDPFVQVSLYNRACIAAVREDAPTTLAFLERCVEAGWDNLWIEEDPDLAFLRGDERFEALLAVVRSRAAGEGSADVLPGGG